MARLAILLLGLALAVAACTGTRVELPPVSAEPGGSFPGKIIWRDLLSDDVAATRHFYSELFGWEFVPVPGLDGNYELIRHRGRLIGGLIDQAALSTRADISQWVVVLSVADIEASVAAVAANGGTIFTPPTSLGERGLMAVVADPEGAVFALLQATAGDPADGPELPLPGEFLWDELWLADPAAGAGFYAALTPYEIEALALGDELNPVDYRTLRSQQQARFGLRSKPLPAVPAIWVSYLRLADSAQLHGVVARVVELGGEVLVPPTPRPAGGEVALVAGPSGAGIALQTWSDEQRVRIREED